MFIVHDLDWQFAGSNWSGYFNRNSFDWDWQNCLKIEIENVGIIFTMNNSRNFRDRLTSSKSLEVLKDCHSNILNLDCMLKSRL